MDLLSIILAYGVLIFGFLAVFWGLSVLMVESISIKITRPRKFLEVLFSSPPLGKKKKDVQTVENQKSKLKEEILLCILGYWSTKARAPTSSEIFDRFSEEGVTGILLELKNKDNIILSANRD